MVTRFGTGCPARFEKGATGFEEDVCPGFFVPLYTQDVSKTRGVGEQVANGDGFFAVPLKIG